MWSKGRTTACAIRFVGFEHYGCSRGSTEHRYRGTFSLDIKPDGTALVAVRREGGTFFSTASYRSGKPDRSFDIDDLWIGEASRDGSKLRLELRGTRKAGFSTLIWCRVRDTPVRPAVPSPEFALDTRDNPFREVRTLQCQAHRDGYRLRPLQAPLPLAENGSKTLTAYVHNKRAFLRENPTRRLQRLVRDKSKERAPPFSGVLLIGPTGHEK